jgi:hypothetical protein
MSKTQKARPATGILVPVIEEVPRISESERQELRASLEKARADIAAGNFDVVTRKSLRDEFEDIYNGDDSGEKPAAHAARPRRKR